MPTHEILVTIENKPGISDPEGDTILNDLVLRGGATAVTKIRCSKNLRFTITADSADDAAEAVRKICDDLRIYNPLVSRVTISAV